MHRRNLDFNIPQGIRESTLATPEALQGVVGVEKYADSRDVSKIDTIADEITVQRNIVVVSMNLVSSVSCGEVFLRFVGRAPGRTRHQACRWWSRNLNWDMEGSWI